MIAAAHRIAGRLAQVRSGGDEPAPAETRRALRDVIRHCIYGVDVNPMAVELCKVNLWLESLEPGKPLSFLDAHIKCGNSLVGVGPGMNVNELEIPDEAFTPVTGDDKERARMIKQRNKDERQGQEDLFTVTLIKSREDLQGYLANRYEALDTMPEDNAVQVQAKAEAYKQVRNSEGYYHHSLKADIWTAAFFWRFYPPTGTPYQDVFPTQGQLRRSQRGQTLQPGLMDLLYGMGERQGFFHWPIEFPEVAERGGFDCVIGNPPWERIKLQEEEFFAQRDPEIAIAPNKSARKKLIEALHKNNPPLAVAFEEAKHTADATAKFVRQSNRFPLTAIGDTNTYAIFAELANKAIANSGRVGIIVPTGIATDNNTRYFFGDLSSRKVVVSLFDFENREALFAGVHRSFKFCLLTINGTAIEYGEFVFFATRVEHLHDKFRRFRLAPNEIGLFNPNTKTMPVFRTKQDAELTRKVYQNIPVFIQEWYDSDGKIIDRKSDWDSDVTRTFDMDKFGDLALSQRQLVEKGAKFLPNGRFVDENTEWVQIVESKTFWNFDHRFASYEGTSNEDAMNGNCILLNDAQKKDFNKIVVGRYWLPMETVDRYTKWHYKPYWVAYRNITNSTNERTMVASVIPRHATDYTVRLVFGGNAHGVLAACLLANFNSLCFDYIARQSVAGSNFSDYIMKQLPVLRPSEYTASNKEFIAQRALELVYNAYDMRSFAEDMGYFGEPIRWNEDRRVLLRGELDAYYARLYGLNRKQLRYILDPADLTPRELEDILDPWEEVDDPLDPAGYEARRAASDFPSETFRVLKEKEIKQFGEYRTRRLVLEAWDRLEAGGELPEPYHGDTALDAPQGRETINQVQPRPAVYCEPSPAPENASPPPAPPRQPVHEPESPPGQPMLTDFGLYKCDVCSDLVMGYDRENHSRDAHRGAPVEWKKVS